MVITHIASEMQFREPMRNASSRLFQAMSRPGVTDAQLGVLLNDCRVAYETDKLRRLDTLDVLKAKIGPFLTPRTESMLFLLGLEGDVIITLPTPALLAQSHREQQRLSRVVEGLKLEADSLRRERDDLKAEFQAYQVANQVANAAKAPINVVASAQINPHGSTQGFYALPLKRSEEKLMDEQKEIMRLTKENADLTKENADLQKDVKRLRREKTTLLRSFRKVTDADGKRDTEKREVEKEGKTKADKR
jgi:cell division protein FtsB